MGVFDQSSASLANSYCPAIWEKCEVSKLVRSSAEHFDGSGYPDGLAGGEIPIGARIIAVAVAFAAMTSPRPHRSAMAIDEAAIELRRCAGSQFDPGVVEALAADLAEETAPAPA